MHANSSGRVTCYISDKGRLMWSQCVCQVPVWVKVVCKNLSVKKVGSKNCARVVYAKMAEQIER